MSRNAPGNKTSSLRFLLLRQLIPAMLALLAASAIIAYWLAWRSATRAYDRSLWDIALALSEQVKVEHGIASLQLTPQAQSILLTDKFDTVYYAVWASSDKLIAGNAGLPLPSMYQYIRMNEEGRVYYDGVAEAHPVRLGAMSLTKNGIKLTVIAAETLIKRERLVWEILLGMLLPEIALIFSTLLLVWVGVRSGLMPLEELRSQLAARSQSDLRPLSATRAPDELQPLVQEINQLFQRLEHSLNTQRHFVSDAAHQLRTPVAALQAQVEVALRECDASTCHKLEGILQGTQRVSRLTQQLLALARAEPNHQVAMQPVHLEQLVHQAAEIWLPKAITKQIDFGFELQETLILGNPFLLQEMISNLLDNALRHTPAQGTVNVTCLSEQSTHTAVLRIEDSGNGVPEAERERVFERFYQASSNTPEQQGGSGLGLAIAQMVAQQHGSKIVLGASPSLGGACFALSIPLLPVETCQG